MLVFFQSKLPVFSIPYIVPQCTPVFFSACEHVLLISENVAILMADWCCLVLQLGSWLLQLGRIDPTNIMASFFHVFFYTYLGSYRILYRYLTAAHKTEVEVCFPEFIPCDLSHPFKPWLCDCPGVERLERLEERLAELGAWRDLEDMAGREGRHSHSGCDSNIISIAPNWLWVNESLHRCSIVKMVIDTYLLLGSGNWVI